MPFRKPVLFLNHREALDQIRRDEADPTKVHDFEPIALGKIPNILLTLIIVSFAAADLLIRKVCQWVMRQVGQKSG